MKVARRDVLGAAGALWIAVVLPPRARAAAVLLAPNAFVHVTDDGWVTVIIKAAEFGQGAATGLATLVAEEMDADWDRVRLEFAPNNDALYANGRMGTMAVGGSTTMTSAWMQMRRAGAAARSVLVRAAARRWGLAEDAITVARGVVSGGRRKAGFGELAGEAALLPLPQDVPLKNPAEFQLVGKPLRRLDSAAKSNGSAIFAMDVRLEGMVHALVAHPPIFGGRVASFDGSAALAVPGVRKVTKAGGGIAVFADSTFAAMKGRAALTIEWDDSAAETRSSEELEAEADRLAQQPGTTVVETGAFPQDLPAGATLVEARYFFPYLAHAPMETLNAVLRARGGKLEVWAGSQFQVLEPNAMAEELGLSPSDVHLNQCYAGGSFGRRATPGREFGHEAGKVCAAWGGPEPVKFLWTREDDITGGFYRPMTVHRLRAAISREGDILGWEHRAAGQSIVLGTPMAAGAKKRGYDKMMIEGADEPGYRMARHRLGVSVLESPIPVNWWRSVGFSHTGYVMETMLDRLLAGARIDPVAGRLRLLDDPRARAVVRRAADIADWDRPRAEGRALGIAFVKSFGTYIAEVAEVSRGPDDGPWVHKVWAAVDCGLPINPDNIRAQIEGGIGFALGHALRSEIVLGAGGRVLQENFDAYRSLRIGEMPEVEIAIIASDADPSGIGEPPVPPLAPAVANAWRALTGETVERLPFSRGAGKAYA